MQQILLQY